MSSFACFFIVQTLWQILRYRCCLSHAKSARRPGEDSIPDIDIDCPRAVCYCTRYRCLPSRSKHHFHIAYGNREATPHSLDAALMQSFGDRVAVQRTSWRSWPGHGRTTMWLAALPRPGRSWRRSILRGRRGRATGAWETGPSWPRRKGTGAVAGLEAMQTLTAGAGRYVSKHDHF